MVKSRCFFMLSLIRIVSSLSHFQLRLFMLSKVNVIVYQRLEYGKITMLFYVVIN